MQESILFSWAQNKVRNGSRVGQVGRVELGGQVRDLDPSLLNSRNLSWVGQVGQVEFGGRVNDLDPSAPFCEPYFRRSIPRLRDYWREMRY